MEAGESARPASPSAGNPLSWQSGVAAFYWGGGKRARFDRDADERPPSASPSRCLRRCLLLPPPRALPASPASARHHHDPPPRGEHPSQEGAGAPAELLSSSVGFSGLHQAPAALWQGAAPSAPSATSLAPLPRRAARPFWPRTRPGTGCRLPPRHDPLGTSHF